MYLYMESLAFRFGLWQGVELGSLSWSAYTRLSGKVCQGAEEEEKKGRGEMKEREGDDEG